VDEQAQDFAWLESHTGWRTPIRGTCFLGRSNTNHIVVVDDRVSRRHAMVHMQSQNEYWLIDLKSSNGTYLNGRRLAQAARLADNDRVEVGAQAFIFHHPQSRPAGDTQAPSTEKTIQDIKSVNCWLLVADMEASTQFIQATVPEESLRVTGTWLARCKQVIEDNGGMINKFLGDGFLAYWPERENVAAAVSKAALALKGLQAAGQPRFRVVLHHGKVFLGAGASLGEESLMGTEVHFVFRMEELAGSMGLPCMLSQTAHDQIKGLLPTTEEGSRRLLNFDGEFLFFSF
jgi:class 3 adenylate cyclase